MSKASKRGYHRQDMHKVNRTAMISGGVMAAVILAILIWSFLF